MTDLQSEAIDKLIEDDHKSYNTIRHETDGTLRITFQEQEYLIYSDGCIQLPLPFWPARGNSDNC